MMDRISVIVPVYGVENYLDRCVGSIVSQTYSELEIILVDDGSPDGCPAMCDAWAARDPRIRVIHQENGGLSRARNTGLDIATGQYISFIDSDDWIEPDFYGRLLGTLAASNGDIAACGTNFVDEQGSILRVRPAAPGPMGPMEALERLVREDGVYPTVWNMLCRRAVIGQLRFEPGRCHEDEFWTYRVLDRAEKLVTVPEPLYNYRQRPGSIISSAYSLRRLDALEGRFRRMEYLQRYDALACLARQQLVLDCLWHCQCAFRGLHGHERRRALDAIHQILEQTPAVPSERLRLNLKYRLWLALFRAFPEMTAHIRNLLKIGL